MAKLNASGISRAVSRNLLFAGCVNGSEEVTKELNTCRRAYAGLFFVFLVYALFFLGISAVALFVVMFLLNVLTARPYEIPEGTS
ncbi:hypothetical protein [Ruegeria sp.]|uniref:hypothetical protein n=1 Tax=Ruegeria sp. TaxID=1879320 RepID=UPI0023111ED7|nr:hypothetical protein [Ruegeria sp.]MDA7964601.1 hypothetical protein [Ruegeria sp.]